jgi:hypothetical protein
LSAAGSYEIYHAVRACCPCGYSTELVRCSCSVSREISFDEVKKVPHDALAKAREAAAPHLQQTGHKLPTLEHRFVLVRGGETQDFRAYTDAAAAAEPVAAEPAAGNAG